MTDNEIKKEYLKEYENKCKKLESLNEQMQSLIESSRSAKAQSISDMPKGNHQSDLSDIMVRQEVLMTKIIRLQGECEDYKLDIEDRIADIKDGTESTLLHKKYVEFMTWEQVCIEIHYSWKHTHRIHSNALNSFRLPDDYTISSVS